MKAKSLLRLPSLHMLITGTIVTLVVLYVLRNTGVGQKVSSKLGV